MKFKSQVGILISAVILAGILAIVMINFAAYSKIIREDILNISKLTSTSIFSKISNELTKPIFISLTMANDSFVKDWLLHEKERNPQEIITYLEGIRGKYQYNSSFLVSNASKKYYHYHGLFKTVSPSDAHDVWFFDFLEKGQILEIDVDHDEVDQNTLTLFVNAKIFDGGNEVLGVTGVGIRMNSFQKYLDTFEKEYDLEAFLVDSSGLVQVHTDVSRIETSNFFQDIRERNPSLTFPRGDALHVMQLPAKGDAPEEFVISHYIEDLDWFLIVRKPTTILRQSLQGQMWYEALVYVLVTSIVLTIVIRMVHRFQKKSTLLAHTDPLTGLLNRRGFDIELKALINQPGKEPFVVFLFDIDKFKSVNDRFGHLQGDKVLKRVVGLFTERLPKVPFARWGGDEFAGILFCSAEEAFQELDALRGKVHSDPRLAEFDVTISVGIVPYSGIDTEENLMRKVDDALYRAKDSGKNRVFL